MTSYHLMNINELGAMAMSSSFYCATIAYHVGLNALLVAARHR